LGADQPLQYLVDDVQVRRLGEGVLRVENDPLQVLPAVQERRPVEGVLEQSEEIDQVRGGGVDGSPVVVRSEVQLPEQLLVAG